MVRSAALGLEIGKLANGSNNLMVVAGASSAYSSSAGVTVGQQNQLNHLYVMNGGYVTVGGTSIIGQNTGASNNVAWVSDTGSEWTNVSLLIGENEIFNLLMVTNGGRVDAGAEVSVGSQAAAAGNEIFITGTNSLLTAPLAYVGESGAANNLLLASGTAIFNALYVGLNASSSNNLVLCTGGNLVVTNSSGTAVADVRAGTVFFTAGQVVVDQLLLTNSAGLMTFSGGTLRLRGCTTANGKAFGVGNGVLSSSIVFLGGTNYFANGLNISSNATLQGNGTIFGNVTNSAGGTIAPGSSIGALIMRSNLVLQAGCTNVFELNKTASTNDNITGLASVTYGGMLQLTNLSGTLTNGDSFKLFTAASYTGTFSSLNPSTPGPGLRWYTNLLAVNGFLKITNVPVPLIYRAAVINKTNLIITATNGLASAFVYLLGTTNVSQPLANWTPLMTNQFDTSGATAFTNTVLLNGPQQFFRLSAP